MLVQSLLDANTIVIEVKHDFINGVNYKHSMHYHNAYEIMFLIKSENNMMFIKDSSYQLKPNQIIFISPYVIHTILYKEETDYQRIVLHIEKEFIEELINSYDCMEIFQLFSSGSDQNGVNFIDLDVRYFNTINKIFYELIERNRAYMECKDKYSFIKLKLAVISFFVDIYCVLNSRTFKKALAVKNDVVKKLIQYLDANYAEDISLDSIAERFNISKFYMTKVFKQVTGATIIEYLQHRRVIEVQRMLTDNDKSITDICYECGFNNIQNFYKVFKKITNLTPSAWCAKNNKLN